MDAKQALFGGNSDAQRESVVSCSAMYIHPIATTRPKAVIRNGDSEQSEERPWESQAKQSDLASVRVS